MEKLKNSTRDQSSEKELIPNLKPQKSLVDATAAFTFSRLPRGERIATILLEILRKNDPQAVTTFTFTKIEGPKDILGISEELAQYSVKDFAVRYGHLEDGNAKA